MVYQVYQFWKNTFFTTETHKQSSLCEVPRRTATIHIFLLYILA